MAPLRLAPNNPEAERALLSAIIMNPELISQVNNHIKPRDFFFVKYGKIYKALDELFAETKKIDLVNLADKLEANGDLDIIGGHAELVAIIDMMSTSEHIIKYAKLVKEDSIRRQLILVGENTIKNAHDLGVNLDSQFETIHRTTDKIIRDYENSFKAQAMEFDAAMEAVLNRRAPSAKGFSSGIDFIDDVTFGLKKGHYWIIYGFTGNGKTMLGVSMTQSVLKNGGRVRFLSLEMASEEIWDRLISFEQNGNKEDTLAYDRAKGYKLYVTDHLRNMDAIGNYIKRYAEETDVFFIDYLGMIRMPGNGDESTKLIEASDILATYAKQYHCCIVVFSQTTKEAMKAEDWEILTRGGPQVAAPADVVIRIKRASLPKPDAFGFTNYLKLILQKNRHGKGGQDKSYAIDDKSGIVLL